VWWECGSCIRGSDVRMLSGGGLTSACRVVFYMDFLLQVLHGVFGCG
jgi:hypothetical protein